MTSRSSDRIAALARRRAGLRLEVDKAARHHRGQTRAGRKLRQTTHALLAAELDLARAKPLKRHQASRIAAEPDMFQEAGE